MKDDILKMAREAGCEIRNGHIYHPFSLDQMLRRFDALVRADERERIKAANAPVIQRINEHLEKMREDIRARSKA